jgi:hypothetical protein
MGTVFVPQRGGFICVSTLGTFAAPKSDLTPYLGRDRHSWYFERGPVAAYIMVKVPCSIQQQRETVPVHYGLSLIRCRKLSIFQHQHTVRTVAHKTPSTLLVLLVCFILASIGLDIYPAHCHWSPVIERISEVVNVNFCSWWCGACSNGCWKAYWLETDAASGWCRWIFISATSLGV